jgi:hypothetical protein
MQIQVVLLPNGGAHLLGHVELGRRQPVRELPIEVVEQSREHEPHGGQGERDSWAYPSPRTKGHVLQVRALEVDCAGLEPLRPELLGVVPVLGVPGDGPGVHKYRGALGHVVPEDPSRLPRDEQRCRRMQPQRLLQVFELGTCLACRAARLALSSLREGFSSALPSPIGAPLLTSRFQHRINATIYIYILVLITDQQQIIKCNKLEAACKDKWEEEQSHQEEEVTCRRRLLHDTAGEFGVWN